jgi:hypothetical protein
MYVIVAELGIGLQTAIITSTALQVLPCKFPELLETIPRSKETTVYLSIGGTELLSHSIKTIFFHI